MTSYSWKLYAVVWNPGREALLTLGTICCQDTVQLPKPQVIFSAWTLARRQYIADTAWHPVPDHLCKHSCRVLKNRDLKYLWWLQIFSVLAPTGVFVVKIIFLNPFSEENESKCELKKKILKREWTIHNLQVPYKNQFPVQGHPYNESCLSLYSEKPT